ncbi:hypothetical protein HYT57_02575 [Candidatus Woesearchaeota archaeon]|nr:hypothetical protein [Candidatus Woesearchaeota archaeon]
MKWINYVIAGIIGISSSVNAEDSLRTRYVTINIENRLSKSTPDLSEIIIKAEAASELIPDKIQRALKSYNAKIVLAYKYEDMQEYEADGGREYLERKTEAGEILRGLHLYNRSGNSIYDASGKIDTTCISACCVFYVAYEDSALQEVLLHEEGHSLSLVFWKKVKGMYLSDTREFRRAFKSEKQKIIETEEDFCDPEEPKFCDNYEDWFARSFSYFYSETPNSKNRDYLRENFPNTYNFHMTILKWFGISSLDN